MKWSIAILAISLFGACAHLPGADTQTRQRSDLWTEAHLAFHAEDFRHAREAFHRLATELPDSDEGREALFYLGALSFDPRNPDFDARAAAAYLRQYLALDTARSVIHRRPEATTLVQLAELSARPAQDPGAGRAAPVAAATATVQPRGAPLVSAEENRRLAEEVETLKRQLNERDDLIRRQRDELERIRRVLAPRTP